MVVVLLGSFFDHRLALLVGGSLVAIMLLLEWSAERRERAAEALEHRHGD